MLTYPMTTGRNFDEILLALDSMQLTANHKVATPVNWKQGDDVNIAGSVSDEDAVPCWLEGPEALPAHHEAAGLVFLERGDFSSRSHGDAPPIFSAMKSTKAVTRAGTSRRCGITA